MIVACKVVGIGLGQQLVCTVGTLGAAEDDDDEDDGTSDDEGTGTTLDDGIGPGLDTDEDDEDRELLELLLELDDDELDEAAKGGAGTTLDGGIEDAGTRLDENEELDEDLERLDALLELDELDANGPTEGAGTTLDGTTEGAGPALEDAETGMTEDGTGGATGAADTELELSDELLLETANADDTQHARLTAYRGRPA